MAENVSNPLRFPDLLSCKEQPDGICAAIGCQAAALLINLRDEKGRPGAEDRAKAIIDQARKNGCKSVLEF